MFGHAGRMASITEYDDEFPLLETEGLYAAKTSGAGDCLFNSLSDQLYGHENSHLEIRTRVVEHLRQHPENFMSFIEVRPPRPRRGAKALSDAEFSAHTSAEVERAYKERLARMGKSGTYGDNLEIQAFVNEYDTCVRIFQRDLSYLIRPTGDRAQGAFDQTDRPVLYIAHHSWEHYSSVRNRDGPHTGPPNVRPQPATPKTLEAAEEKLAKSTPFQPWMENAVSTALPYTESAEVIMGTLKHFGYDVNEATLHLISKWEEENAMSPDESEPQSPSQPEAPLEALPKTTAPEIVRDNLATDTTSGFDPEIVNSLPLPPTPPSSIDQEVSCRLDVPTEENDDEPRAKRRKSPDGTPVAPFEEKHTPGRIAVPKVKSKTAARKSAKAKSLAQPTRRSARIQAKTEGQSPRTVSVYAESSSSDEESCSESSSGSECMTSARDPPRSRKQQRKDAKAATNKRKDATSKPTGPPSNGSGSGNGGKGLQTVTSGIRELYV